MKTAICDADLKRSSLCETCKKKLDEGEITELDIGASRLFAKMSKKLYFGDTEFKKAIDLSDLIVLVCVGNIGVIIGKGGKNVAALTNEFGKKVRVIERTADEKKMIQDLVGEARVLGVNKIFSTEGREHKILIKKSDKDKMATNEENLKKGLESLLDTNVKIMFV